MEQSVEYSRGDYAIPSEDLAPLPVGFVRSQDHGALLVALADDLKEQRGRLLIECLVTDFINDQHLRVNVDFDPLFEAAVCFGPAQALDHLGYGGKVSAVSSLCR